MSDAIAQPGLQALSKSFEPAALVIACEGAAALRLQHETGEIIERVNAFLGFGAIGRLELLTLMYEQVERLGVRSRASA